MEIINISLLKTYSQAVGLFKINQRIVEWDLSTLKGKGLVARFAGSDAYAHIEITIQKSSFEHGSTVKWSINENQIPYNFGHKPFIDETLSFFTNYVSGIKGERLYLEFEITNIGIHLVNTRAKHFAEATMKALINSFDKTVFPFDAPLANRISQNSYDLLKKQKISFLRSEIIESLKRQDITEILSKIFNTENVDIRMLKGFYFNNYISDSFNNRKTLLQDFEIDLLEKLNAVSESGRITDIGKAHVAKILNDRYDMNYHFNIKFEDFQ